MCVGQVPLASMLAVEKTTRKRGRGEWGGECECVRG